MDWGLIIQAVEEFIGGLHPTDIAGALSPAALIYAYWAERRIKDQKKQTEEWKAEADKYQGRWVKAMKKMADHGLSTDDE